MKQKEEHELVLAVFQQAIKYYKDYTNTLNSKPETDKLRQEFDGLAQELDEIILCFGAECTAYKNLKKWYDYKLKQVQNSEESEEVYQHYLAAFKLASRQILKLSQNGFSFYKDSDNDAAKMLKELLIISDNTQEFASNLLTKLDEYFKLDLQLLLPAEEDSAQNEFCRGQRLSASC